MLPTTVLGIDYRACNAEAGCYHLWPVQFYNAYSMLNYCMEQSSFWEANRFVTSQEFPRILCNPNVH
jgi:hypothetical protein